MVFDAAITLRLATLSTESLSIAHRHSLDADPRKCLVNGTQFRGLNHGDYKFHSDFHPLIVILSVLATLLQIDAKLRHLDSVADRGAPSPVAEKP